MLRVALTSLLSRKLRLLLTSVAIVLGVAFVSGAFFLTDSLRQSFTTLFARATESIDVHIQTEEYHRLSKAIGGSTQPGTVPLDLARIGVPPEIVERVREVPGVRRAKGTVFELGAQPLDDDGKPVGGQGAPSFAAGWVPESAEVGALRIVQGKAPGPRELMFDESTMKLGAYELGDDVRVLVQGGRKVETFTVSGVVRFARSSTVNGATITVFQMPVVQRLLDMDGRFTAVDVIGERGVGQETLRRRIAAVLDDRYRAVTGEEFAQEQAEAIDAGFLGILQNVILGFAAVAVFVGAFTIFNTFTILVGQRTREFGLLRALGAGRRQVLGIVVLEAIALGLLASTLGLIAGYGVAWLLRELVNSVGGGGIPEAPFPLRLRTVAWAYAVGVLVTVVAAALPAWRAARLSPLEALRASVPAGAPGWRAPAAGALLVLAGSALVARGFTLDAAASATSVITHIGGGFATAIVGLALLSRILIGPFTRVLGRLLARGTAGRLASRNVLRNRARAATTSSALMIGLALAALTLVFHASLGRSIDAQIDEVVGADVTIYNSIAAQGGAGLVPEHVMEAARGVDGVAAVVGQRIGGMQVGRRFAPAEGDVEPFVGFDAGALGEDGVVRMKLLSGSRDPADGVLVDEELAQEEALEVGDRVQLAFPTGAPRRLRVVGIFEPNQVVGARVVASTDTFDEVQPAQQRAPGLVYVDVEDDVSARVVAREVERAVGDDASYLQIQDSAALREEFREQLQPVLLLVLAMLSLSLVIALFGIGNTLALNVFERTREIGLLRAVGGTRRQLRHMIRVEAVLVALFGAMVGIVVGIVAGAALIRALQDEGFRFAADPLSLGAVLVAGFLAGVLASVLPARRAAQTDVLAAIATE